MPFEKFKVIIVGGGVAGLSLALMLENFGINFTLLEAYSEIAPQVGASIGLLGNGLRILDQLGCYEELRRRAPDDCRSLKFTSGGRTLALFEGMDKAFMEVIGYPFKFMDRQTLLQVLYEKLEDKSKVLPNKQVSEIIPTHGGVTVVAKDGSKFDGDIVIGSDGIHSTVRKEMWRIATIQKPGYFASDLNRMKCEYSCIFGISTQIDDLTPGDTEDTFGQDWSSLVVGGSGGRAYWFFYNKLDRTYDYGDLPRFTKDDEMEVIKRHWNTVVRPGKTLGDFYSSKYISVMTTLDEAVFSRWHFGRMMIIGDAAHKMSPVSAQGGNSAIEDGAALVNEVVRALELNTRLSDADVSAIFEQTQRIRKPRMVKLFKGAYQRQRVETMATPLARAVALYLLPRLGCEGVMCRFIDAISPAVKLNWLVVPRVPRQMLFADELPKKPEKRGAARVTIMAGFMLMAFISWKINPYQYGLRAGTPAYAPDPARRLQFFYFLTNFASFWIVWSIESTRKRGISGMLYSPLIWGFLFHLFPMSTLAPLYYLQLLFTYTRPRDYLSFRRQVSPETATAVLPATVLGFLLPSLLLFVPFRDERLHQMASLAWRLWPALVSGLLVILKMSITNSGLHPSLSRRGHELAALKRAFAITFLVGSLCHVVTGILCFQSSQLSLASALLSQPDALMFFFESVLFLVVVIWDLERIGFSTSEWRKNAILVTFWSLLAGPGAMAAAVWYWRELVLGGSGCAACKGLLRKELT